MPLKRNGIRTKFLKDAFNNLFKTNLPKNKIQPTNDKPTLQQRQSIPKSQQTTNRTSSKNKNSSSSQRSSKGSQKSLTDVEIFVDSLPSSVIKAERLTRSKGTQPGMQMSLPWRTSRSSSSASQSAATRTKSSASQSAASGTKSSASPKVEAITKSATSAPAVLSRQTKRPTSTITKSATSAPSRQTKRPTSTRTKSATSAPAVLSRQTKRPSSTTTIGLENMGALPIDIILKEMFKKEKKSFVLDFNYLEKIKKMSMILALSLNPLFKKLELPQIETYLLPNIITINLTQVVIDEFTLYILNLTVEYSKVSTIILRNITFKNDDIVYGFLQYLEKNTQIERLILRQIHLPQSEMQLNKLVDIIGKLTNITLLEFSNFSVNSYFHNSFLRTLIKLKNLKHLIFNNNIISSHSYGVIFSGYDQFLLPYSGDVFKDVGVYFVDNYVIKTNFYDNSNKQYKYDNRMTIYSNLNNLENLENLENLDDPAKFKQMSSLNFHAKGNYYLLNKHDQFFSNSNVSERKLYDYTSASIQDIMNKLNLN